MSTRILVSISVILFFANNYAQDKKEISSFDLSYIKKKDTVFFEGVIEDLRTNLLKGLREVSIEEIDTYIDLAKEMNYNDGLGKTISIKARIYRQNMDYEMAVKYYKEAIVYFKKTGYEKAIAVVNNALHITEKRMGNLEKSAYYLLEAKNYFEKEHDSVPLIYLYSNLGGLHMKLKNYEYSKETFLKAITLKKKSNNIEGIGSMMTSLAEVYIELGEYDKAEYINKESLIINKKDSVINSLASSYFTYGEIKVIRKEYEKAEKYYDSALFYYLKIEDKLHAITTEQRIAEMEMKLGNYTQAKKMLQEVRVKFNESDSKVNLLENYQLSSKLDSLKGNLKGALAWQHKYQILSDQIASDLTTNKIEKREKFYEAELEQLRTLDEQELREQKNKEELYRYRVVTLIILGVLSICLLFVLWIIKTRKERKKLILKLNDSNQVKNKLFSIISHDLKNEIHGLESSLNLMKDNEISTDEFDEIVPLLSDRTNQTSILLNNLLNWSKSQMKELRAKPIHFDVSEVISNKFIFFKPKANQKKITLVNKLDTTNVYADKDMVAIVAQNLIANAIKFCNSEDTITILSAEKENYYEIRFADTGVGIAPDNIKKLFAEETFTTHGTQNESGTGLGLRICKELIELNNGTIKVESNLGKGSTFIISLPKEMS